MMVWKFICERAKRASKILKICEVAVRKITSNKEEKTQFWWGYKHILITED